ncbi:hypothetical protein [Mucisphaera calidilacus]|uniref:Uncharacterized protein n=1 Tax=Mucisphaera calidilacus TaxID=2527982 RepID=A0A518BYT3_9BACT|nr:hypothetical protein [Mucisphaera calidilacus]QDU72133.1 hypothetical protein Pan265_19960 [Mucisphaera calidilacus]
MPSSATSKTPALILTETLPDPYDSHATRRLGLMLEVLAERHALFLAVMATGRMHLRAWRHANRLSSSITIEPLRAIRRGDLPISRTVSRWVDRENPPLVVTTSSRLWPALRWFRDRLVVADLADELAGALDPGTQEVRANGGARRVYQQACRTAERTHLALVARQSHVGPLLTRAGRTVVLPDGLLTRLPEILDAIGRPEGGAEADSWSTRVAQAA